MTRSIAAAPITMLLATALPSLSFSQAAKTADECDRYTVEMAKDLDTLEVLVPNVSPDEATFLEKEYSTAIRLGSGKRIYDVENRATFLARNLHNAFKDARENVKLSQPAALTLKMKIQMAARIPYRMANAKIAWDRFSDDDNGKILTLQQVRLGAGKSEHMIGAPGLYILCLATFQEPQ